MRHQPNWNSQYILTPDGIAQPSISGLLSGRRSWCSRGAAASVTWKPWSAYSARCSFSIRPRFSASATAADVTSRAYIAGGWFSKWLKGHLNWRVCILCGDNAIKLTLRPIRPKSLEYPKPDRHPNPDPSPHFSLDSNSNPNPTSTACRCARHTAWMAARWSSSSPSGRSWRWKPCTGEPET